MPDTLNAIMDDLLLAAAATDEPTLRTMLVEFTARLWCCIGLAPPPRVVAIPDEVADEFRQAVRAIYSGELTFGE